MPAGYVGPSNTVSREYRGYFEFFLCRSGHLVGGLTCSVGLVDVSLRVKHHWDMRELADIERAVKKLSSEEKKELLEFLAALLRAESNGRAVRNLSPGERAEDLKRWAASHERGPGLPNSAIGRDAIYD